VKKGVTGMTSRNKRFSQSFVLSLTLLFLLYEALATPFLLILNGILVIGIGLTCMFMDLGFKRFFLGVVSITWIIAFGLSLFIWSEIKEQVGLKAQYPVESLSERLTYETRHMQSIKNQTWQGASKGSEQRQEADEKSAQLVRLKNWEKKIHDIEGRRRFALARLHDFQVRKFIESPGFGFGRGVFPKPEEMKLDLPEPISVINSDDYLAQRNQDPLTKTAKLGDWPERLHENSLLDFINPKRYGWVRNRDHVAGFQPHVFTTMPKVINPKEPEITWRMTKLELVSLLKYDAPRVYLSDHLPRMDELRDSKTRNLDEFESQSLIELEKGGICKSPPMR
jgi:hypothetical protein